jgi:hypothetical protein
MQQLLLPMTWPSAMRIVYLLPLLRPLAPHVLSC